MTNIVGNKLINHLRWFTCDWFSEPVLPDILKNILLDSQMNEVSEDINCTGLQNTTSTNVVSPLAVGVLNGAKPFTQVLLNPAIGVMVDK